MSWLNRIFPKVTEGQKKEIPDGVWMQCESCQTMLYSREFKENLCVCSKCNYHHRLSARERLIDLLDECDMKEIGSDVEAVDSLDFHDTKRYKDRLTTAKKKSAESEAVLVMSGRLSGSPIVAAAFEFQFVGGSMGAAVGERLIQGIEESMRLRCPFICFSSSGGARMQEGVFSLTQMARVSASLTQLAKMRLPFISVLLHPTSGGVSASIAMLGDVIIAEPRALIGFAGPRVIEQTVREKLPEGFQRSEFLLENGAIDQIVDRRNMKKVLSSLLDMLMSKHL